MGTINYKTSKYITMGIKPYENDDYLKDADFISFYKENYSDIPIDNVISAQIEDDYSADYENAKNILENYSGQYINISFDPGYYEGFSILIDTDFSFYDPAEKDDAKKESAALESILKDLAGIGLVACFPGWVTGYLDYAGTLKEIETAIQEMQKEIENEKIYE